MVFNWFRRQFGTSETSSEEAGAEDLQVEQEQKAPEPPDVEPAKPSTDEQSSAVAEDYLIWAKAAYKNIQKQQQQPQEAALTATEPPESTLVEESATQPATTDSPQVTQATAVAREDNVGESAATTPEVVDSTALTDTGVTTSVESEEPATSEIEEASSSATDVSQPQVEPATTETAETVTQEGSAPEEVALAQPQVDVTAESQEAPAEQLAAQAVEAHEPETIPEAQPDVVSAQEEVATSESEAAALAIDSAPETVAPVLEEPTAVESVLLSAADSAVPPTPVEAEEAPTAPVPIWARSTDRQERLERLKATAIETPEPEPIRASVQAVEATTTRTVEMEAIPGLAFDEGFLWSAEVLAAQGRRPEDISLEEISWLKRLRQGLDKTRRSLINQLKAIVGQGPLNQDAVMEIEALLLQADVGVEATDYIITTLQQKLREEVLPPEQAIAYLKQILRDLLDRPVQESYSPTFVPEKDTLNIWLMTGVNGVGKTTTIGKLAHLGAKSGYRCLIAAADTFRAAAVEQVKVWGERSGTEVIANPGKNTDPAAVVFDAIAAAQSRNTELLLVDTAGRLQNKKNLMEELAKIRRIVDKKAPDAKIESLLVLDATLGQNGLRQAEVFSEAAKLSGVVLTKLDSTAKGGVALAVVQQLGLPIRFIGAGEGIEDLRPFSSYEFVEALLSG
jgi:fused signal recognition particle receptor